MSGRLTAPDLIDLVLDDGSYRTWDEPLAPTTDPARDRAADRATGTGTAGDEDVDADVVAARRRTGLDESVITGEGLLRGRRVAVVACEFAFLAGSIGVAAAERLVTAVERATAQRLPLLAAPSSAGTRMQEGAVAFLQMVKMTAAIARHKAAGLPYLVYLRDPTFGGVLASWASLGHITVAEPGARIGFLGPRVYRALHGQPFPEGVQVAESLHRHGLIDAVLPVEELAEAADRALRVLLSPPPPAPPPAPQEPFPDVPAWESITISRRGDRPGVREVLRHAASDVVPLNGTGAGETDPALLLALARFGGVSCVLLGQDRRHQQDVRPLGPAALRVARRGMRLASELRLPLLTVIDTPGAALSPEAERGGLAGEIARCIADLVQLETPTLSLLLGQGGGGAALALLPCDRVLVAQHGWLSPLPPEGASAIVHRDVEHAPHVAAAQGVRSADLLAGGIADRIVTEHPDAAEEPQAFCRRVGRELERELAVLLRVRRPELLTQRVRRYRVLGDAAGARSSAAAPGTAVDDAVA